MELRDFGSPLRVWFLYGKWCYLAGYDPIHKINGKHESHDMILWRLQ